MRPPLPAALAVVLLTACSGGSGQAQGEESPSPGGVRPSGFVDHTLGPVSFSTPPDWVRVDDPGPLPSGADAQLAVRAPGPQGQPAPVAVALLDATPARGAAAEADSLAVVVRDVRRADDVRTERVELPGFGTAVVVSYTQEAATTGRVRSDVLVGDLDDGALWTLTVMAPAAQADDLTAIARSATTAR